jgi:iron complex outermembrane receptor protein
MTKQLHPLLLAGLFCTSIAHGLAAEINEQDYFSELPVVLSVTRLAQPLNDTPGAVTVIDREIIRRSGAREVTDVLRLVPGYLVGGKNGAHPTAAYHAPLDDYGARNLVLIDGRPVYSSFYLGDTHRGMMGVLVEDIERIEVLRGSNSAAYGANAMFGVINIITRHTDDTHGGAAYVSSGGGGIKDNGARIGWGNETASFRLSTGRRQDSGWGNAYDEKIIDQTHFRGDLRPGADQELMLSAGYTESSTGDGEGSAGNPYRKTLWRDVYLHAQWRNQLSETDEIKLTANYDEGTFRDAAPYAPDPSVTLDFGGRTKQTNLEFQHQIGMAPQLRAVWGAGYKQDEARSPPLFYQNSTISIHEERLFGNLEWRPHPQWLINAGGFWSRNNWTGTDFSPRLMANFHVTPDHTLRAGATDSSRAPNLFELASDVRYYPKKLTGPLAAYAFFKIPVRTFTASGNVEPEKLHTQEIGYFGNFRAWRLTLDVRGFVERTKDIVTDFDGHTVPGYVHPITGAPLPVTDFVNGPGFKIRGLEYQMRWKPLDDTEIWVNQTFQKLIWDNDQANPDINHPPTHATTLALFQKLPGGLDLSLMFHTLGSMSWGNGDSGQLPNRRRIDARLAYPFRIGDTRMEAAVTAQAANGNYPDYLMNRGFEFERRAFGTLRIEF